MAQQGIKFDREKLCCSMCLDRLKDPRTIPCGHSYCMSCINSHWDEEDQKGIHSCPQCRQTFRPRPVLVRNTVLADLLEEVKDTGLQAAPADLCYAGPGDVACDFCSGRKLKAVRSCLQCLVSYCEQHLQPHYESPAFGKHKLVDPSKRLQESVCSRHGEMMRIFCRTDQQCICYLCSMDEHKGHDTVSAAAEINERQREVGVSRQKIQQRIQEREKDVKTLQQEVETISHSADKAVTDSEKIFTQLIRLFEKKSSDMSQQIRSQQKTEINRAKALLQKLEEEITELKRKDAGLQQLSHTGDQMQFLRMFPLLSGFSESTQSLCPKSRRLYYFEGVTAAVSEVKVKLQNIFCEEWPKLSRAVTEVNVLLPQEEPKTRAQFLQYSCQITLDPNTTNRHLVLSEGNRKVTYESKKQTYPSHPERFMNRSQVLSRESLTGRHYWEVEWSKFGVFIGVMYKNISRTGDDSEFGNNAKSWALLCSYGDYKFLHNKFFTPISRPLSSRVGVYLDHSAGVLSFYSVSDTMTLLHTVQTTFTQPLYVGLRAYHVLRSGSTAVFCDLS